MSDVTRTVRSRVVFIALIGVLAFALLTVTGFTLANLSIRNAALNERAGKLEAQIAQQYDDLQASQANAQRLYDQLLELGERPDGAEPDKVVTPSQGPQGNTGAAGRPPSTSEIAAAVAEYCATGACVGAAGAAGASGTDGQSLVGPQGPPGDSITGPQGPPGPAGPTCPDGYTVSYVWLSVGDSEFDIPSRQPAAICRPI